MSKYPLIILPLIESVTNDKINGFYSKGHHDIGKFKQVLDANRPLGAPCIRFEYITQCWFRRLPSGYMQEQYFPQIGAFAVTWWDSNQQYHDELIAKIQTRKLAKSENEIIDKAVATGWEAYLQTN